MAEVSGGATTRWLAALSLVLSVTAVMLTGLQAYVAAGQIAQGEEASRRQLRAYVGSESVQLVGFAAPNRLTLAHSIRNFGQTPANRLNYAWASRNEAPDDKAAYPTVITSSDQANGASLMPSASGSYTDQLALDPDAVADFARNRKVMTYFGVIHYADSFGGTQVVHFCYVLTGDVVNAFRKGTASFATKCATFNDGS